VMEWCRDCRSSFDNIRRVTDELDLADTHLLEEMGPPGLEGIDGVGSTI
jgi:hypothetical protein